MFEEEQEIDYSHDDSEDSPEEGFMQGLLDSEIEGEKELLQREEDDELAYDQAFDMSRKRK